MSEWDFDTVVIGCGMVGMAIAAAVAARGQAVLALEAGSRPGEETSARNSEVVHAGLYYPTGTLKHRFCVTGRRMLYDFMDRTGVDYRKCGKLIVATSDAEEEQLGRIHALGTANGVEGLEMIPAAEVARREPVLSAQAALLSHETGVFDSHSVLQRQLAVLEAHEGLMALRSPVASVESEGAGFRVHTGGDDPTTISTRRLVNAAGLWAPGVARRIEGMPPEAVPDQWLAKGCYFRLSARSPFSHLIYPVPVDGGLGVHATLDLGGATRFGPDVEWLPPGTTPDRIDYRVDPARAPVFEEAIRRYWPDLPDGRLEPDYSGVRPKLRGPGEGFFDFDLQDVETHGLSGLVNLFGMESPGLTSALALGEAVAAAVCEQQPLPRAEPVEATG
ncbi:NAD(P)/FAD-dependent oxidoreductase [Roseivivax marinus]|uniref:NAD(P)/FAD-dependent oxidoreductase n=1 Tax=Roseivivax marinus TaxID=1379903 RepID=UPI00273F92CF|nr:NAD(P)/FAD-dependent oxidoreductase [Roseivivax marinus]